MPFFDFKEPRIDRLSTYNLFRLWAHFVNALVPNWMGFKAIWSVCLSLCLMFPYLLQNGCIMEAQIFREESFWGSIFFRFKKRFIHLLTYYNIWKIKTHPQKFCLLRKFVYNFSMSIFFHCREPGRLLIRT